MFVKARHAQMGIPALAVLGEAEAVIRQQVGSTIARIEAAARTEWLPISCEVEMVEATWAVCGEDGVRRRAAAQLQASADGPLLRPLREGAARLFGLKPSGLLRFADAGIKAGLQGCGTLSWRSTGPNSGVVGYRDVPAELFERPAWHAGLAGAVEGVLAVCNVTGTVTTVPGENGVDHHVQWG